MPTLTLPDGSQRSFATPLTGTELAADISKGLAKKAIGMVVDGQLRDLGSALDVDAEVRLLTADNDDPEALYLLRHSAAHVMAEAICELHPGTKLAYGPPVEDGFYYDLATPRPLTPEDFPAIEKKMAQIVRENRPFTRLDCSAEDGLNRVGDDKYKKDNAERALARGSESLSFYATGALGENWEDLCAGPHVPSTKFLANTKIMSVAGSFWHGDHNSDRLTRVYGTAFADKQGLKQHLQRIEEAKRRDHRKIGKEMDLFHLAEENPGQIYWHPKGWDLYLTVENYIRNMNRAHGYEEIRTPNVQPQSLWESSGHWAKYRDNMFITHEHERSAGSEGADDENDADASEASQIKRTFAIKPMNCPGHIEVYKNSLRSHRELPVRLAEFGSCIRYEPSGALHGIMRVRGFVQDDAHIFCTEEQIGSEVSKFCDLLQEIYEDFGFPSEKVKVKFATRPEVRVGSDEDWDRAEAALEAAVKEAGLETSFNPGEGAFYGPKLEFALRDSLGRDWQCGTIQVDYQLNGPDRLNATYVAEDGSKKHPVLLHRAICGSLERFIGILIEHYEGKFPLWLAPEQIRLLPITDEHLAAAETAASTLAKAGIRASVDEHADKLGAKIRKARNARVGLYAVIGEREAEEGTLALHRQDGSKLGTWPINEALAALQGEINSKGRETITAREEAVSAS